MKKITTILFDLDGTLLKMDQDEFISCYFSSIITKLVSLGYDKEIMKKALYGSVSATLRNDGSRTNERRFWETFVSIAGEGGKAVETLIGEYYRDDFKKVIHATCAPYPRVREVLDCVKACGFRAILATNPLFPIIATHERMARGGLSPSDFEYVTAYENSSYCKPNPRYFEELLEKRGISADECVMIGNDTGDDFAAHALGIPVFILTDCLINKGDIDLSAYPHGSFDELIAYIESLNK